MTDNYSADLTATRGERRYIMREAIKEMKLSIINDYGYTDIEFNENNVDMGLIYEDGKIIYYTHKEDISGTVIYNTKEEFLKSKINDIIKRINEAYFYL